LVPKAVQLEESIYSTYSISLVPSAQHRCQTDSL
jgi:hypothetical protein